MMQENSSLVGLFRWSPSVVTLTRNEEKGIFYGRKPKGDIFFALFSPRTLALFYLRRLEIGSCLMTLFKSSSRLFLFSEPFAALFPLLRWTNQRLNSSRLIISCSFRTEFTA